MLTKEQEHRWSDVIGGLFLNFGGIEFLAYRWVKHLNPSLTDMAIFEMKFWKKLKTIRDLIGNSDIPAHTQKRAIELWDEVETISRDVRNPVAHNPWVFGKNESGMAVEGIIDVKSSEGSGPFRVGVIPIGKIHKAALRSAELSNEIGLLLCQSGTTKSDDAAITNINTDTT